MTRLRTHEDGWAMAITLVLMTIMMTFGLASLTLVDTQTNQSRVERNRESAFNLAEGALNAQIFNLSRSWPGLGFSGATGAAGAPYGACVPGSSDPRCPDDATLRSTFTSRDYASGASWRTEVHDNGGAAPTFYSDTTTRQQPGYDANGDGRLWVRAEATVRTKKRTMVALTRVEQQNEDIPRGVLIAGRISISNNGRRALVDPQGSASQSGIVAVRCTPTPGEAQPCLGHALGTGPNALASLTSLLNAQVAPNVSQTGYGSGRALGEDAVERLKATAVANGTYYTSCPASPPSGAVVVIDTTASCSWTANGQMNSATTPGLLMVMKGSVAFGGTLNMWGIVYHANELGSSANLVSLQGNAIVHGGVIAEGNAGTVVGSSGLNVQLDDRAFSAARSYGSAGIIQNTYREIRSP